MTSSGKIIIKPRSTPRSRTAARRAPSEASSEAPDTQIDGANTTENDQMDEDDDNVNDEDDASNPPEDEDQAEELEGEEAEDAEVAPVPTKRGRGRPKGSGTKSAATSTPRGRTRGRGRPRGRSRTTGGGLTIRLKAPKGDEEEGSDEEFTPEAEAVGSLAASPMPAETKEGIPVKEKEAPMGGGKPFRKIGDKIYVIEGDEFVTEDDSKGDEKIDKWGNLLGGRKFKASTFALPNRHPRRQYMLAIDAARTSGFRDSLYYFRRNPLAFKLNATQPEKDYLISEGKLGSHLRTRSVTLITARSAFKLHGSKMIIDGRWVTDDYYEDKVIAEITAKGLQPGDLVGELPDPNAPAHPQPDATSMINSTFASSSGVNVTGGGGIYRAGGPTTIFGGSGWGPFSDGPLNAVRKSLLSRDGVTEENWMWMMAGRVGEADEEWARLRREGKGRAGLTVDGVVMGGKGSAWSRPDPVIEEVKDEKITLGEDGDVTIMDAVVRGTKRKSPDSKGAIGIYEPHTNLILYHPDTQPTRARWEPIPNPKSRVLGGTKAGNGAWALTWVDTVMQLPDEDEEARKKRDDDQRQRETFIKEAEEMFDGRGASIVSGRGGSVITRDPSVLSTGGMGVGV